MLYLREKLQIPLEILVDDFEEIKDRIGSKVASQVCVRCKGRYITSATSHKTKCGICAPYKYAGHSRASSKRPKFEEMEIRHLSWYADRAKDPDPKLPFASNKCKCPSCGQYFGGERAFDMHLGVGLRVGGDRACLPPSSVSDKQGRHLLKLNDRGYWIQSYG